MPKVNVYLPDELAEAVRASGVPVSTVCQRALEDAVREVGRAKINKHVIPTFERFTNRARNAVRLAAEAADRDGVDLGSEHVLLGLIAEGEGVGFKALVGLGVTAGAVTAGADKRSSTADGNAVYLQALHEALKLGHNYIGTEHMLLAIGEINNTAREILSELGVTASGLRRQVIAVLTGMGIPAPVPADTGLNAKLDEVLRRLEELEKRLPA
jgi:ATP-dependent Clp protease ATP-binding subunit ClpA